MMRTYEIIRHGLDDGGERCWPLVQRAARESVRERGACAPCIRPRVHLPGRAQLSRAIYLKMRPLSRARVTLFFTRLQRSCSRWGLVQRGHKEAHFAASASTAQFARSPPGARGRLASPVSEATSSAWEQLVPTGTATPNAGSHGLRRGTRGASTDNRRACTTAPESGRAGLSASPHDAVVLLLLEVTGTAARSRILHPGSNS
jgi:hypothetical protein